MDYIIKTANELYSLFKEILLALGTDERNADCVAEHLVSADLSGVGTHGAFQLLDYVNAINAGEIVPTAQPSIISETPNTALVTGNWTFGHVAVKFAMELAIQKAKEHNMAVVSVVQSNHIGRLGYYVELAASEGMISMVWTGGLGKGAPAAIPYGGRKPIFHTNPISMGFPAGKESQIMFDYATSAISGVKIKYAQRRNQKLPPGCIVDKDGNPSTDPNDFFAGGAHVPFGGHKGYAIMMAAEILGRVFPGSDSFAEAGRGGPVFRHQGVTIIVFKADLFQPYDVYASYADELERKVRAVPPAAGFNEVLVPGDPEIRARAARQRDGIPIAKDVWESLNKVAKDLGLEI